MAWSDPRASQMKAVRGAVTRGPNSSSGKRARIFGNLQPEFIGASLQRVVRVIAWVLAAAILVLSLAPSELRPETSIPHKLEHFLIFAATGVAFGLGYEVRRGFLAIQLVMFAGAVEIGQLFVSGRHARLSDFLIDAISICAGLIAGSSARYFAVN
jgi:VanZ family protein